MKKVINLLHSAAQESVLYLKTLKSDNYISNDLKQRLSSELEVVEKVISIESSGITTQWLYLMKSEQVNRISFSLGQISTLICSSFPSSEIEKVKCVMIASNVISTYLSMESQSQF